MMLTKSLKYFVRREILKQLGVEAGVNYELIYAQLY